MIKFVKQKGGDIVTFVNVYPLIKLGLKLISSTGKCIRAKKAAGEEINLWDYIECMLEGLNPLESDLLRAITDITAREKQKEVDNLML